MKTIFLGILVALCGCQSTQLARQEPLPEFVHKKSFSKTNLRYRIAPLSKATKYFLIAGSEATASFAQEVLDQKQHWLNQGAKPYEIACYYVIPHATPYDLDKKHWKQLEKKIGKCYRASMKVIRAHLLRAASSKKPFLYLYITSHGQMPVSRQEAHRLITKQEADSLREAQLYSTLDQYRIDMQAVSGGTAHQDDINKLLTQGKAPNNLLLTPKHLKEILLAWPKQVPKFVVFQGCHSGGFIQEKDPKFEKDLLTSVPNSTVITSSRFDRRSFGCQPGNFHTDFGFAFKTELSSFQGSPERIPWGKLYQNLIKTVANLDATSGVDEPPSKPQAFSNYRPYFD